MATDDRAVLEHLGRLAAELGPMLAPPSHDELLEAIASAAREIFEAGACSIALLDEEADELVFRVAVGGDDSAIIGQRVPVGEGIAGWVVAAGQPITIEDVAQDPRFARELAEGIGYVPRTIVAMPLETERAMVGVIEVLDPGTQLEDEMRVLALFARQAALALEAERVFGDLGRVLFAAAAKATDEPALADALDDLAGATRGPSQGLAALSAQVAELVRLGPAETDAAAALMGDLLSYARGRRP